MKADAIFITICAILCVDSVLRYLQMRYKKTLSMPPVVLVFIGGLLFSFVGPYVAVPFVIAAVLSTADSIEDPASQFSATSVNNMVSSLITAALLLTELCVSSFLLSKVFSVYLL